MMLKDTKKIFTYGFTIIELLVVVSIIGVISAISIVTINSQRQQNMARDGVLKNNIQKISEVVESYRVLEGEYPSECPLVGGVPTPPTNCNAALDALIDNWPSEIVYVAPTNQEFAIYAPSLVLQNTYYKYSSNYTDSTFADSSINDCGSENISTVGTCSDIGGGGTPPPSATLSSILVSPSNPAPSITLGSTLQFSAQGQYSDGSVRALSHVEWNPSNGNATITSTGLATAVAAGTVNIIADASDAAGGFATGRSTLTITAPTSPPTTSTITITPTSGSTNIEVGSSIQVTACYSRNGGPCDDITLSTDSQWTSSNTGILSVTRTSTNVVVTGVSQGSANVNVTYRDAVGTLALNITPSRTTRTLTRVEISPTSDPVLVLAESSQQFSARAYFSDNTSSLVTTSATWSVISGQSYITLSATNLGLVSGRSQGAASIGISYTYNGVTQTDTSNIQVISYGGACTTNANCMAPCPSGGTQICNLFSHVCYCPVN